MIVVERSKNLIEKIESKVPSYICSVTLKCLLAVRQPFVNLTVLQKLVHMPI